MTLPEGLTNGDHHLVATGVDADGNVRNLVVEVTVSGGAAALRRHRLLGRAVLGAGALALLAGGGLHGRRPSSSGRLTRTHHPHGAPAPSRHRGTGPEPVVGPAGEPWRPVRLA